MVSVNWPVSGRSEAADASTRLALAVPTYNRSAILEKSLRCMLPDLRVHRVAVYISDNSEDASTRSMIGRLRSEYPHVYYRQNTPSVGFDRNVLAALSMPDTDYVWLLADSVYCKAGQMSGVLRDLDSNPDLLFINSYCSDHLGKDVEDIRGFLADRTWYITLLGATLYGRGCRALAREILDAADRWRNFVHLGLILKWCGSTSATLRWRGTPTLGFQKGKKSYWSENAIPVFAGDWSHLIESFPELFSKPEMGQVIRSHGLRTGLFGLKHLLNLRAKGGLTFPLLREFQREFRLACPGSPCMARAIAAMPARGVDLLRRLVLGVLRALWKGRAYA